MDLTHRELDQQVLLLFVFSNLIVDHRSVNNDET